MERHIQGKWACDKCETLIQAPVLPQVIDKGIPTAGLLAQVLVAKYAGHLPLYHQERIFGRAGLEIPRSTLAEWVGACVVQLQPLADALRNALLEHGVLHAGETPVSMLAPGQEENPQGVCLGVLHHAVLGPESHCLRLRAQPGGLTCPHLPGRLAGQARV